MAKTYYLSEEISQTGKKLGKLSGWKKEIAKSLLDSKSSENEIIAKIQEVINNQSGITEYMIDDIIPLLPKNIRNKAKIISNHLLKHIKIGDYGQVIYPDGKQGGSFIDHLKYLCSPSSINVSVPFDIVEMRKLLESTNAPKSCMRTFQSDTVANWISL